MKVRADELVEGDVINLPISLEGAVVEIIHRVDDDKYGFVLVFIQHADIPKFHCHSGAELDVTRVG